MAKLTREMALEAYRLATETGTKVAYIAKQIGCDEGTVRKIRRKEIWKDATDAYDSEKGNAAAPVGQDREVQGDGGRGGEDHARGEVVPAAEGRSSAVLAEAVAPEQLERTAGHGEEAAGEAGEGDPRVAPPEPAADPCAHPDGRRDLFPDTLPPRPRREKQKRVQAEGEPVPPVCPKGLESSHVQVLLAAKRHGLVRELHGFGGKTLTDPAAYRERLLAEGGMDAEAIDRQVEKVEEINETFVSRKALVRQINLGHIAPGEHANTYVLTDAGRRKLAEYDEYLDAHNSYINRLAIWRREVRRKQVAENELKGDAP